MTISLLIDAPGGADLQGHHLRDVASLHIGGRSLASETLEVTGTALISEELKVDDIVEATTGSGVTIVGLLLAIVSKTASYTAVLADSTILCDAS